jgi:hypothetical protein
MWNMGALWRRASRSTMSATVRPERRSRRFARASAQTDSTPSEAPCAPGGVSRPSTVSTTSRMVTSAGGRRKE